MQNLTKDTEQEIVNKSFDETFQVETAIAVGYDPVNDVLRPVLVNETGKLYIV
jgi:hypothetical protein